MRGRWVPRAAEENELRATPAAIEDAFWSWEFVDNSEVLGVKNTGYAIGLLQIGYKVVTDTVVPNADYRYQPAP